MFNICLVDESLLKRHHYNILNGSRLTGLTCNKAPDFWMVKHQLVYNTCLLFVFQEWLVIYVTGFAKRGLICAITNTGLKY